MEQEVHFYQGQIVLYYLHKINADFRTTFGGLMVYSGCYLTWRRDFIPFCIKREISYHPKHLNRHYAKPLLGAVLFLSLRCYSFVLIPFFSITFIILVCTFLPSVAGLISNKTFVPTVIFEIE